MRIPSIVKVALYRSSYISTIGCHSNCICTPPISQLVVGIPPVLRWVVPIPFHLQHLESLESECNRFLSRYTHVGDSLEEAEQLKSKYEKLQRDIKVTWTVLFL